MEESHQEATEKEVERIFGYLKRYYQENREYHVYLVNITTCTFLHCGINFNCCLGFCCSNNTSILLWLRDWPRLICSNSGERFPHVFSNPGEVNLLKELVCHLVTVSRHHNVSACVSGWFGKNVSWLWQITLYRWEDATLVSFPSEKQEQIHSLNSYLSVFVSTKVPVEEGEVAAAESCSRKQCIMSISPKTWKVRNFS